MAARRHRWIYNDPRWMVLRSRALRRSGWRCEAPGCTRYAREVHHVVPLHRGGPPFPELDGLRVLCRLCHYGEHRTARQRTRGGRSCVRVRKETHAAKHRDPDSNSS